jgi:hypothetical protein
MASTAASTPASTIRQKINSVGTFVKTTSVDLVDHLTKIVIYASPTMEIISGVGVTVADPLITILKDMPLVGPIFACVKLAVNFGKASIAKDELGKFIELNITAIQVLFQRFIMLLSIKKIIQNKSNCANCEKLKEKHFPIITKLMNSINTHFQVILVYTSHSIVKSRDIIDQLTEIQKKNDKMKTKFFDPTGGGSNGNIIKKTRRGGHGDFVTNIVENLKKSIYDAAKQTYGSVKKTNDIDRGSILVNRSLTAINMGLVNLEFIFDAYFTKILDDEDMNKIEIFAQETENNTLSVTSSSITGGTSEKTNPADQMIEKIYTGIEKVGIKSMIIDPQVVEEITKKIKNSETMSQYIQNKSLRAAKTLGFKSNETEQINELAAIKLAEEAENMKLAEEAEKFKSEKPVTARLYAAVSTAKNAASTAKNVVSRPFKKKGGKRTVRLWPPRRGGKRSRQRVKSKKGKKGVRRTKKIIS